MTINEMVLDYVARNPRATNAEVAAWVREQVPGAETTPSSVSSIKSRSRDAQASRPQSAGRQAQQRRQKHTLPVDVVRATLAQHGIASINVATEWAAVHGLRPSSIVSIVRGPDVKGARKSVDFELADDIATALGDPGLWTTDWAIWARPAGPLLPHAAPWRPGDEVEHDLTGRRGKILWMVGRTSGCVLFDDAGEDGDAEVVPMHLLVLVVR